MAAIYSAVKFKKTGTRETGDGKPSQSVEEKEDITYSTLKFTSQAAAKKEDVTYSDVRDPKKAGPSPSDLSSPDDAAGPSSEPVSKVKTTGRAKERLVWILLCVLLFAVSLTVGVLYLQHEKHVRQLTDNDTMTEKNLSESVKMLQAVNGSLTQEVQWLKNNLTEKDRSYRDCIQEKEKSIKERDGLIEQLKKEKTDLSQDLKEKNTIIKELQAEKDQFTKDLDAPCVGDACCAEGWKYFSGSCYFFSTDVKTWTESRDACVAKGGDLVIISGTEEQEFLKRWYPGPGEQQYWVGMTDAVKEGDWRWLDGTRLSKTPKYWNENQPDNWKGKGNQHPEGEDCAEMLLSTKDYLLWDAFCHDQQTKKKYVCEAKAPKMHKTEKLQLVQ